MFDFIINKIHWKIRYKYFPNKLNNAIRIHKHNTINPYHYLFPILKHIPTISGLGNKTWDENKGKWKTTYKWWVFNYNIYSVIERCPITYYKVNYSRSITINL